MIADITDSDNEEPEKNLAFDSSLEIKINIDDIEREIKIDHKKVKFTNFQCQIKKACLFPSFGLI
jgi:hypothetical protein